MKYFEYKEGSLYCEEVELAELPEEFGTPLYVYSRNQLVDNFRAIDQALTGTDHVTCYALKANSNPFLLKTLSEEGAGADVVSAGEIAMALKAGFHPDRIAFAGVGKQAEEMEYALKAGIFCFNVESIQELQQLSLVALRTGQKARVAIRINPNINAESHPYISTGLREHKFGIEAGKAVEAFQFAAGLPNLEVIGLHMHIGSQILKPEPYRAAVEFAANQVRQLRSMGIQISHLDLGGGFGVRYVNALAHESLPVEPEEHADVRSPAEILADLRPLIEETGCTLWLEPGRSIAADAGVLLTKVLYTKENGSKKFVVVDAGMNDLIRPSLYDAYHQIVPLKIETYEHDTVDVVGPVCETGDFFARNRRMPRAKQGDALAILTTGAYGFVATSNYNARLQPAEVLVNGDKVRVIRPRQTIEQLIQ